MRSLNSLTLLICILLFPVSLVAAEKKNKSSSDEDYRYAITQLKQDAKSAAHDIDILVYI